MKQISASRVVLSFFFLSVFLSFGVNCTVHGADPGPFIKAGRDYEKAISRAKQRVSDAERKLESTNGPLSAAKSRLRSLINRQPKPVENWKRLRLGEFESEAEFRKRVARTKANDQRLTAEAVEQFELQKRVAQRAVDQARGVVAAKTPASARELAIAQKAYAASVLMKPELSEVVYVPKLVLPRFNRETMSFGPVHFDGPFGGQVQSFLDGAGENGVQLEDQYRVKWNVASPTLLKARSFKEGLADGTIRCKIEYKVKLKRIERPFTVTKSVTKDEEEIDWGTRFLKFGFAALVQGLGGDPPPSGALYTPPKKVRRTRTKKVTKQGTRYHYELIPIRIGFVRKDGTAVPSTEAKVVKSFRVSR